MNLPGYILTYRQRGAEVSEVYACPDCTDNAAPACECIYRARQRAHDLDREHQIRRNGRLLAYHGHQRAA
jgi:hypothetical protein